MQDSRLFNLFQFMKLRCDVPSTLAKGLDSPASLASLPAAGSSGVAVNRHVSPELKKELPDNEASMYGKDSI